MSCLYQCTHFIRLDIIKVRNVVQSLHNSINSFIDQRYDFLHIHFRFLCNFSIRVQNWFFIFESLFMNRKDFIAQDGTEYSGQLVKNKLQNWFSLLRVVREIYNFLTLKFGWTKHLAKEIADAVNGPVIPIVDKYLERIYFKHQWD